MDRRAQVKRVPGRSDKPCVKLVACQDCHAQYDISSMAPGSAFDCRCGASLEATPPAGLDAIVRRCSACGAVAQLDAERCEYCTADIVRAPDQGSLICPECMARNLDGARFCLACGIGFEPQLPVSDAPELRCPCCERWMAMREVGGFPLQECPKCLGLWAPDGVMEALVDRAASISRERLASGDGVAPRVEGGNPASDPVAYRRCPSCDSWMVRSNFRKRSGVIIDRCHEHGTWLDANELERIAGFILSGRARKAAQAEQQDREERERREAREAVRRVRGIGSVEQSEPEYSIFSNRPERSAAGSVLDLLISILN